MKADLGECGGCFYIHNPEGTLAKQGGGRSFRITSSLYNNNDHKNNVYHAYNNEYVDTWRLGNGGGTGEHRGVVSGVCVSEGVQTDICVHAYDFKG